MNDPARTARLQAALATLEEATADPMMLAMLSPEELARLRRAAGEIFSPDVDLRRRISRARARGQKVAQIEREQAKLDQTGIRKLRREPIFTAPNLSPHCMRWAKCIMSAVSVSSKTSCAVTIRR